jgi:hypothetical protein
MNHIRRTLCCIDCQPPSLVACSGTHHTKDIDDDSLEALYAAAEKTRLRTGAAHTAGSRTLAFVPAKLVEMPFSL